MDQIVAGAKVQTVLAKLLGLLAERDRLVLLPDLLAAAARIRASIPAAQFLFARAPHLENEQFAAASQLGGASVVEGETDAVLAVADVALTASGTATVQAAPADLPAANDSDAAG